jgi:hypothetical protein
MITACFAVSALLALILTHWCGLGLRLIGRKCHVEQVDGPSHALVLVGAQMIERERERCRALTYSSFGT